VRAKPSELPDDVKEFFRKQGSKGGKLGGRLSWEKLTPEQRSARARKASLAAAKARQIRAKKDKG
jgi:hypothetical protein